jgi:hypothetical protein
MCRKEVLIISLVARCIVFLVLETKLKPLKPEFNSVSAIKPMEQVPTSNAAQAENPEARNRIESTQLRELYSRGITEFWQKFGPSLPFIVLIWLAILPIIQRWKHRMDEGHGDEEWVQKWNELEMLLRRVASFLRQSERSMALTQEEQVKHCHGLRKEIGLLKKRLMKKEELIADFPDETDLEESVEALHERSAKLLNGMDFLEKAVKEEDERLAQMLKDVNGTMCS